MPPLDDSPDGYKHHRIQMVLDHIESAVRTRGAHAAQYKAGSKVVGYKYQVPMKGLNLPSLIDVHFLDDDAWVGTDLNTNAGGLGNAAGIWVRISRHRKDPPLMTLVKEALKERRGWTYETIVHEVTHYLDANDGKLKFTAKDPQVGTAPYYRLGWEQEARFQQLLERYITYISARLILFMPYDKFVTQDGQRPKGIFDPSSWILGFINDSGISFWRKYDEKMKGRVVARLCRMHVPVVASIIQKKTLPNLKKGIGDNAYTDEEGYEFISGLRNDPHYSHFELRMRV